MIALLWPSHNQHETAALWFATHRSQGWATCPLRAAGLVINEGIHLPRKEVDALKAILHNCVRLGPASQNLRAHPDFRAHLLGRISYLATVNSARAEKLRRDFEQIDWSR